MGVFTNLKILLRFHQKLENLFFVVLSYVSISENQWKAVFRYITGIVLENRSEILKRAAGN